MMPSDQIWSCHVTQDADFENFLFCSDSVFNIWKRHKISGGKALNFRSYQPKTSLGGGQKTSPVLLRLMKWLNFYLPKIP